ncbi:MAG: hypothetical protein M0C28_39495 [Candidatus Moduliflexus flocculans]|nr:hypothetical protein [Candidatus Moduliflexus flocculans]
MLLGYDHGLGVTWDGGKNWYHPDYLPLAQFYAVDYDMSWPYRVAGGLQDNGIRDGPEHQGRRRGGTGRRRPRAAHPPRGLVQPWAAGTGCTTSSTGPTNRDALQRVPVRPAHPHRPRTPARSKSIAYQRLKPETRWNWCAPILVSAHDGDVGLPLRQHRRHVGQPRRDLDRDQPRPDDQRPGRSSRSRARAATATSSTAPSPPSTNRPSSRGLLWAGTDDGNVWVTRDNGKSLDQAQRQDPGQPGLLGQPGRRPRPRDPATAYVTYTGLPQRRLPAVPLQDDGLRRHLDLARRRPGRRAGQRRPRGPQEPEPALRRHGLRRLRLARRRQDLAEDEERHADPAGPRPQGPAARGRPDRRHARPRRLHRRHQAPAGAGAGRPGRGPPPLHGRNRPSAGSDRTAGNRAPRTSPARASPRVRPSPISSGPSPRSPSRSGSTPGRCSSTRSRASPRSGSTRSAGT